MDYNKEKELAEKRLKGYLGEGWYSALSDALIKTIIDVIIDHRRNNQN